MGNGLFKCPNCGEVLAPTCFYCGERTEDNAIAIESHIMTCEKHPIRGVYRRVADAKAENERLKAQVAVMAGIIGNYRKRHDKEILVDPVREHYGFTECQCDTCDRARAALSAAPKVLAHVVEANAYDKPHHGLQLAIRQGRIDTVEVVDYYDWESSYTPPSSQQVDVFVVPKPEQGQESEPE